MAYREMQGTKSDGGGEWTPLPAGDYAVQFDSIEFLPPKSADKHPQMKISGHVEGGAYGGKNCTIFYSQSPKSLWKTEALLEASGIEYDLEELGADEEGHEQIKLGFDDDDLVGCSVLYTVSQREYNGKMQNDFNKERAVSAPAAAPAGRQAPSAGRTPAAAPASQPTRVPAVAAPALATPPTRTRRTTQGAA
jgi:hypothetical protein